MSWDCVEDRWEQMKDAAKRQWGMLTDDDLRMIEGNRDRLVGRIHERYGVDRDAAEREVIAWARSRH